MKVQVTFKTPDAVEQALDDEIKSDIGWCNEVEGLPWIAMEEAYEDRLEEAKGIISKWVEYGEYVTIEFDTETKTAKVLEA
jgi:hypothetical protein